MFCVTCGNQIAENANFCHRCGQKVVRPTNEMAATQVNPQYIQPPDIRQMVYQVPMPVVHKKPGRGRMQAASLMTIVSSSLWGIITLLQIVNIATGGASGTDYGVAIWNTIFTVVGIIEGSRLWNGGNRTCREGIRATVIGIIWYAVQGLQWHTFVLLFAFIELATLIVLLAAKDTLES